MNRGPGDEQREFLRYLRVSGWGIKARDISTHPGNGKEAEQEVSEGEQMG